MSYADLLEFYSGVQSYNHNSTTSRPYLSLIPDTNSQDGFESFSGNELLGSYFINFADFTNRPIWSVLQQYQNSEINELFTCLRTNAEGKIVPQVIFRQIPFTTPTLASILDKELTSQENKLTQDNNVGTGIGNFPSGIDSFGKNEFVTSKSIDSSKYEVPNVTPFHNLPRWKLDDAMIKSIRIGRSDATRTNLVHIYGQTALLSTANIPVSFQMVNNRPIMDQLDIQRSGIRAHMATVASVPRLRAHRRPTTLWGSLASPLVHR